MLTLPLNSKIHFANITGHGLLLAYSWHLGRIRPTENHISRQKNPSNFCVQFNMLTVKIEMVEVRTQLNYNFFLVTTIMRSALPHDYLQEYNILL